MNLPGLVFLLLLTLKLTFSPTLSWWWVFFPLMISFVIALLNEFAKDTK